MTDLRDGETRDDSGHADALESQLAEADDELRADLETTHGDAADRPTCTDPTCDDTAEYAYWMPDMGDFCRVRAPETPGLEDGDLCPYVCASCRDWRIENGRYDADRFVDPRERLVTDGGLEEFGVDCPEPEREAGIGRATDTSEDYKFTRPQCRALTADDDRCSNSIERGGSDEFCPRHAGADCETIDDRLETDGGNSSGGAERFHDVLSVLRDFERARNAGPRPLAVVSVEKFLFDAKDAEDLDYGTIRNAMEQTNGRLCLRYDDGYGHGYLALENGEFKRVMKPNGFDRYNGPFGISVDLLEEWLRKGKITLTVREKTPFADRTQQPETECSGGDDS